MDRNVTFSSARVKSERTNGTLFELGHPFVGLAGRSSDLENVVPLPWLVSLSLDFPNPASQYVSCLLISINVRKRAGMSTQLVLLIPSGSVCVVLRQQYTGPNSDANTFLRNSYMMVNTFASQLLLALACAQI